MVEFDFSTIPSDLGRNGVVRVLCMPKIWHISLTTLDSKLDPWSIILSTNFLAMVVASALGIGIASVHLVK
jgi:hypothetical protein